MNKKTKSLKHAFIALAVSKYSVVIINLVFTMILARLLSPEDYGIVAVANVFTNFFILFSDMGISAAVIQNKELTEKEIQGIYVFTIRLGICLGILFSIFSLLVAYFYKDSRYIIVICLLSVSLVFSTFNMVPNAIIMKDKWFNLTAVRTITSTFLSGLVTLVLALLGMKYYAIIFSNIFNSMFVFLWNKKYVKLFYERNARSDGMKKIFSFSSFQFAFNFVSYFSRNLDNLMAGKFLGNVKLGYYDKAYTLTQYPLSAFSNIITPALHPFLSDKQDNKDYIFRKYIDIQELFIDIGVFVTIFLFYCSSDVVIVMFGKKWIDSIPCLKYLGVSLWAQLAVSCVPAIFQSIGDTRDLFILSFVNAVITAICVFIGVLQNNIIILSILVAISYIIHYFIYNFFIFIRFKISLTKYMVLYIVRILLCSLVLILLGTFVNITVENVVFCLLIKIMFFSITYFLLISISGELKVIMNILGISKK